MVSAHEQFAGDRDFGFGPAAACAQVQVGVFHFPLSAGRVLGGFDQQEAQER